jgi:putative transposase
MARSARLSVPGAVYLVSQRGVAGTDVFRDQVDADFLRLILTDLSRERLVVVHAYAWLSDRFLLLMTPLSASADIGRIMQRIGRRYVRAFNARHGRHGTLWASRFCSSVIEPGQRVLQCMRWLETGAGRLQGVADLGTYQWSSYPHHVGLTPDPLVTHHDVFWRLGNTPFERQAAYAGFCIKAIPQTELDTIERCLARGEPYASPDYIRQLATLSQRPLIRNPVGRPKRAREVVQ